MNTIGVAMIVGGMAFLFSGLIFLIPIERKSSPAEETIEDSIDQVEHYLRQVRRERWHPVESTDTDQMIPRSERTER